MKYPITSIQKNGVRICIDQVDEQMKGRAYSLLKKKEIKFTSWMDFLLEIDELFDEVCFPQAFEEKRTFVGNNEEKKTYHGVPDNKLEQEYIQEQWGNDSTYEILVISRRRVNWQGKAYKLNKDKNEKELLGEFQSEMDFLEMMGKWENILQ